MRTVFISTPRRKTLPKIKVLQPARSRRISILGAAPQTYIQHRPRLVKIEINFRDADNSRGAEDVAPDRTSQNSITGRSLRFGAPTMIQKALRKFYARIAKNAWERWRGNGYL